MTPPEPDSDPRSGGAKDSCRGAGDPGSGAGEPRLRPDQRERAEGLEAQLSGRRPADEDSELALDLARLREWARPTPTDEQAGARARAKFYARLEEGEATLASGSMEASWSSSWARTLSARPIVRLAAASLLLHLLALPVFAWWIGASAKPDGLELRFLPPPREVLFEERPSPEFGPLTPADLGLDARALEALTTADPAEFRRRARVGLASLERPVPPPAAAQEPELERAVRAWLSEPAEVAREVAAPPSSGLDTRLVELAQRLDDHARAHAADRRSELERALAPRLDALHAALREPGNERLEALGQGLLHRALLQGCSVPAADWKPNPDPAVEPRSVSVVSTWDPRPILLALGDSLEPSRSAADPWRTWLGWAAGSRRGAGEDARSTAHPEPLPIADPDARESAAGR